jgi:hypothetical protein
MALSAVVFGALLGAAMVSPTQADSQKGCGSCLALEIKHALTVKCADEGLKAAETVLKQQLQAGFASYLDEYLGLALDVEAKDITSAIADEAKTTCAQCYYHVMDELEDNQCCGTQQCGWYACHAVSGIAFTASWGFSPKSYCNQAVDQAVDYYIHSDPTIRSRLVQPGNQTEVVATESLAEANATKGNATKAPKPPTPWSSEGFLGQSGCGHMFSMSVLPTVTLALSVITLSW